MQTVITYPQYRKYKNNKHYFKITSKDEFEEISFIGSKKIITQHVAKILPDRNFIDDLLNDSNIADAITANEYNRFHK